MKTHDNDESSERFFNRFIAWFGGVTTAATLFGLWSWSAASTSIPRAPLGAVAILGFIGVLFTWVGTTADD